MNWKVKKTDSLEQQPSLWDGFMRIKKNGLCILSLISIIIICSVFAGLRKAQLEKERKINSIKTLHNQNRTKTIKLQTDPDLLVVEMYRYSCHHPKTIKVRITGKESTISFEQDDLVLKNRFFGEKTLINIINNSEILSLPSAIGNVTQYPKKHFTIIYRKDKTVIKKEIDVRNMMELLENNNSLALKVYMLDLYLHNYIYTSFSDRLCEFYKTPAL